MSVDMERKYLENLIRVSWYLRNFIYGSGSAQKNPKIILEKERGRCIYDRCPYNNKVPTDIVFKMTWGDGSVEKRKFHGFCIDSILRDERLPVLN